MSLDTEEKAYWLGVMVADDNVVTGRPIFKLTFASQDRDHLLKIRSALQSTHAITDCITTIVEGLARVSPSNGPTFCPTICFATT